MFHGLASSFTLYLVAGAGPGRLSQPAWGPSVSPGLRLVSARKIPVSPGLRLASDPRHRQSQSTESAARPLT